VLPRHAHVDPGGGYSADVVGERHYAYLSSRAGAGDDCPAQGVRVFDLADPSRPWNVADPAHPGKLATVRLPTRLHPGGACTGLALAGSVHDAKAAGRYAYFSWYGQGVALFDLKNPGKPRFVTRFRPPPERDRHGLLCSGESCTAVWGVFVMPRYVLASDLNSGLWVLARALKP
jgi:hypothetical protein